jgi:hypothetical protein
VREPMDDIKAVKWLSLKQAVEILTLAHEKVFLANVGPLALKAAKQSLRDNSSKSCVYCRPSALVGMLTASVRLFTLGRRLRDRKDSRL